MTSRTVVWLVARREITAKLRDKGFLLSTAFILALIVGSAVLPVAFSGGSSTYDVGVVGNTGQLEAAVLAQADAGGVDVELRAYDDTDAAKSAVAAEQVVAAIDGGQVVVDSSLDPALERVLNAAAGMLVAQERLAEAGIDPAEVAEALSVPPLDVVPLDTDAERNAQRQFIAFLGVVVLYGLMILIGQYVAMGVVEEKSSRVVELLLSTIKPWQLLAGKVIGLGLLGLAQLLLICVAGLAAAIAFDVLAVPGDAIGAMAHVIGWFILGYALYAALFATGAALVSRQEDLQTVLMPLIGILVAAFVVAIQAAQNPDGVLARITSLVPALSPMVMPVRSAAGAVAWWELVLAVVLNLVAIALVIRLGGRVYAGALLRTGGKVKIKDALAGS
ncbi:MAG: ABC transporter permease [Actinomycetota bacterium]|nr:ABC transporter permease [Actinomycetota bacterium]